jgi:hypothetical protein
MKTQKVSIAMVASFYVTVFGTISMDVRWQELRQSSDSNFLNLRSPVGVRKGVNVRRGVRRHSVIVPDVRTSTYFATHPLLSCQNLIMT